MRRQRRQGRGAKIGLTATASLILLAGCSSVPDAVNPVEWYKGAASLFEDDAAPASDQPASDPSYPNLASVPARPTDISTPSERRAVRQGLVADREQARYTDQQPSNAVETGSDRMSSPRPPAQPSSSQISPAQAAPAMSSTPSAAASATDEPASAATGSAPRPAPPAAPAAPRNDVAEPVSAGTAMMERRRQEVLAERAAAATAGESKQQQPSVAAPEAPLAAEINREQFARSASPVATRSAEPKSAEREATAPASADRAGISYLAATILFGHGSTALDPAERENLRKIAAEYRKNGGRLRIVGHASSRTTDMPPLQHQLVNFQVSVSRAEAVARELVRLGVPATAMEVIGVGDSQPIYYEVMPAGEAGNRRVEIFVDH